MKVITINVVDKVATAEGNPFIVCGNSDYTIRFNFDSAWSGQNTKTARFTYEQDGEEKYAEVVFAGSECQAPVIQNTKKVYVGVYAGDILSTTRCGINCKASILDGEGVEHEEPAEDVYNQIVEICEEAVAAAGEATAAATEFEATTRESFANAVKNTLYGPAVTAGDVSPVEHTLACKVESKNLFNAVDSYSTAANTTYTCDIGTLTVNGYYTYKYMVLDGGETYTLSFKSTRTGNSGGGIHIAVVNGGVSTPLHSLTSALSQTVTFTIPEGLSRTQIIFYGSNSTEGTSATYTEIMLERGGASSGYIPYVDPATAKVARSGKNLFTPKGRIETNFGAYYDTTKRNIAENCIYKGLAGNNYYIASNINSYSVSNPQAIVVNAATAAGYGVGFSFKVKPGDIYTLSAADRDLTKTRLGFSFYTTDGVYISNTLTSNDKKITTTVPENAGWMIALLVSVAVGEDVTFKNVQIEAGAEATTFEAFKEADTYTANADGTVEGIASLSPNMTLLTDTAGTVVNCGYNKDTNKALASMKTADGTVVSQNADFAEVAEWADGNPDNEDRTGYFVCANVPVDGIVMKKATSTDDVKGVTILAPAFAGNYTKDKLDSNGRLLPKYSYVAIIGFVPVRDNGTCSVGGRCMPDDNGCAVPSSNSMGYQVVNRIDENRVLIIIEPNGDMIQRIKAKINKVQEDLANIEISGGNFVSYSQTQNLTPEQKETARGNIGVFSQDTVAQMINDSFEEAVPKSLVVDNLVADKQLLTDHIPNGQAVQSFIEANAVSSAVYTSISENKKQIARTNIGAISQAELDEAVANIGNASNKEWKIIATGEVEEDGVTKITITKDNDGNPFEIYDALVVYTDAPIATETVNIYLAVNNQYSNLAFQALHKSGTKFARITANWDGGNWAGISLTAGNSYSWATSVGGMTQYYAKKSPATSIILSTNSTIPFPIGTKFELRGVVKV